ncbi:MAG: hypothetical protein WCR49_10410 [Opitutae bacterium]
MDGEPESAALDGANRSIEPSAPTQAKGRTATSPAQLRTTAVKKPERKSAADAATAGGEKASGELPPPSEAGTARYDAPAKLQDESNPASRLVRLGSVWLSAWEPRLMQDVILPTSPMLAEKDDRTADLREKTMQEQRSRMPATFGQPEIRSGFVLEFPAAGTRPDQAPRWSDARGAVPAGATAQAHRAEIAWFGTTPPTRINYALRWPDGRQIAQLSTDENGRPVLATAPEIRSWRWIGIAGLEGNQHGSAQRQQSLEWRRQPGGSIPLSWRQDHHWLDGSGHRVELPLSSAPAGGNIFILALVDTATGWAIAGEVNVP